MEKNTIVIVEWGPNNQKTSNKSFIVGRFREVEESDSSGSSVKLYGFCLEGIDTTKDCQLHGYSLHEKGLKGELREGSKKHMREFLIHQLDKALDHLFSEESSKEADDYEAYRGGMFQQGSMTIN